MSIHPFEDRNSRIGRAIAEKAISEALGRPTLISLSHAINARRNAYYEALERANTSLEITNWLLYFAATVLEAQDGSLRLVESLIAKAKFYERFRGRFNARQKRLLLECCAKVRKGSKGA